MLTILLALAIVGPARVGALTPFMMPMGGSDKPNTQPMLVFDEEAFEYRTAGLITNRSSGSSEYASASGTRPGSESSSEKSRLVEDVD